MRDRIKQSNKDDAVKYNREMEKLKKERVKADYSYGFHGLREIGKIEASLNSVRGLIKNKYI